MRIAGAVLALLVATLLPACAARRPPSAGAPATSPTFGVYKGAFHESDGSSHRFRLLVYAEAPDRLHVEVMPPIGGPELILDGGGGRLSVTVVRERTAWVGDARASVFERLLGVAVDLEGLVLGLVRGTDPGAGVRLTRSPPDAPGLPRSFAIASGGRRLEIELRRLRTVKGHGPAPGTATPPPGVEVRPLEEIGDAWDPVFVPGGRRG